jgi:hypothetical protein
LSSAAAAQAMIKPQEPIGIRPISTWCVVMRVTRKLPKTMPAPSVAAKTPACDAVPTAFKWTEFATSMSVR